MVRVKNTVISILFSFAFTAASDARAESIRTERVQTTLETWVAERVPVEKILGSPSVSFLAIPVRPSKTSPEKLDPRHKISRCQNSPFQMGSTSRSFAAALILELEAAGKLSIDDTVGKWLPQYPAWKDVSVRRLFNMTGGIPNYSETEAMSRTIVSEPTLPANQLAACGRFRQAG